jgi:hypothetical protein
MDQLKEKMLRFVSKDAFERNMLKDDCSKKECALLMAARGITTRLDKRYYTIRHKEEATKANSRSYFITYNGRSFIVRISANHPILFQSHKVS